METKIMTTVQYKILLIEDNTLDQMAFKRFVENNAIPAAIPAGDGINNLLKFAFNLDPTRHEWKILERGTGTTGLPHINVEKNGPDDFLRVEYLRRRGVSTLAYAVIFSEALIDWEPASVSETVTPIDSQWERVVVRHAVDLEIQKRLFGAVILELVE